MSGTPGESGLGPELADMLSGSSPVPEPQKAQGPTPQKTAETSELDRSMVMFFGMVGPVDAGLSWGGHVFEVSVHILTVEEENKLVAQISKLDAERRILAEAMMRMAYSLRAVNGVPVHFGEGTPDGEWRARLTWIAGWPATLLDAAMSTYAWAARQPLLRLEEMRADPNTGAAPSSSGG